MKPILVNVDKNDKSPAGKKRKQFNNLLNKIDGLKTALRRTEEGVRSGMIFFHAKIEPLRRQLVGLKCDYIRVLDGLHDHKIFTKKDREKIAYLIVSESEDALSSDSYEDLNEIRAIHDRYAEESADEKDAEAKRSAAGFANNFFGTMGFDLNIDPDDTPEEMLQKAQAATERLKAEEAAKAERSNQKRAENAKQAAKMEAAHQEVQNLQKASKTIYNDLVKLLHPDLERDETAKIEKTEAIKKVNEAYQNNDFFALLTLQSEYLARHGDSIAQLPDQQFNYYIKILKDQKTELEAQLDMMEMMPGFESWVYNNLCDPNPLHEEAMRKRAVKEEKDQQKQYRQNIEIARSPEQMKAELRRFRIPQNNQGLDLFDMLQMLGDVESFSPGRKKRR
jgi:hypothetical protein